METLTDEEYTEIKERWSLAKQATGNSTWPGRVGTYGPMVAQLILDSWEDMPTLFKEINR